MHPSCIVSEGFFFRGAVRNPVIVMVISVNLLGGFGGKLVATGLVFRSEIRDSNFVPAVQ